jgi:hypothetical protein
MMCRRDSSCTEQKITSSLSSQAATGANGRSASNQEWGVGRGAGGGAIEERWKRASAPSPWLPATEYGQLHYHLRTLCSTRAFYGTLSVILDSRKVQIHLSERASARCTGKRDVPLQGAGVGIGRTRHRA